MATNRNATPMTTPPTEHDQPPLGADPDSLRPVPRDPADGGPGPGPEVFPARPSTRPGGPAPGPGGTGRDAASPADQAGRLLGAEDGEAVVSRAFEDFEERLVELVERIVAVLQDGRLDAGRRQALSERIAVSTGHLADLADAVETDLGRCER
jgi:hypothetical protein